MAVGILDYNFVYAPYVKRLDMPAQPRYVQGAWHWLLTRQMTLERGQGWALAP